MNPQEQNNNQPENNLPQPPPSVDQQPSSQPLPQDNVNVPQPPLMNTVPSQPDVSASSQPQGVYAPTPESQAYGPQQTNPVQSQPVPPVGQPTPAVVAGSPLAAGSQGTDYYANDTSKSPMLGIISFVLAITVIFAPIGFILGVISIVKAVKAQGKSKSLMIFGVLGTVISTFTSWISFTVFAVALFTLMQNIIGGGGAGDYTKVSARTLENNSKKITVDVPQKYKIESDYKENESGNEMKGKIYSSVKLKQADDGSADFKIDGIDNFNIRNGGGVMVSIADKDNDALKFTPGDLAQIQAAQPGYFDSVKEEVAKSLSSGFSSDCSDNPELTSDVATPENKSIDVYVKISCELKEEKVKATFKFKLIMSETGRMYIIGVIETKSNYDKYSSEIDSILKGAKIE